MADTSEGDSRGTLGHAVTGHERALELEGDKLLDVSRHGRPTGDEHLDVAAKGFHKDDSESPAEIRIVLVVGKFLLTALAVDELSDGVLDQLGEDERHREED